MVIPISVAPSTAAHLLGRPLSNGDTRFPASGDSRFSHGWSSLIGIITAIVGNILISFALNIQRYAHIRLAREWEDKNKWRQRAERKTKGTGRSYGSVQVDAAGAGQDKLWVGALSTPTKRKSLSNNDESEIGEEEPLISGEHDSVVAKLNMAEEDSEISTFEQTSYLRSPFWWTGIVLMTVGEAGNFLAYGFAPASIVSPLGVVALISNCIIAPFMLKEPFRTRDFLGVVIAVAGAVTVALSASGQNPKFGPHEIWNLITTWEFELYLGITIGVILVLMVVSNKYGEKSIFIDLALVGLFGGYTALATKGVASLLSYKLWRVLTFPLTYLLVAVLVGTAVLQIKYINRALQRFDSTQVIPTQFVLFTLSVILGSAVLYRDFEKTPGDEAGKFIGGCAMTFLGVGLITSDRASEAIGEGDLADENEEDTIRLIDDASYVPHVDGRAESDAIKAQRGIAASDPVAIFLDPRGNRNSDAQVANNWSSARPQTPTNRLVTAPQRAASDDTTALTANPWRSSTESVHTPSQSHHQASASEAQASSAPTLRTTVSDSVLHPDAQPFQNGAGPAQHSTEEPPDTPARERHDLTPHKSLTHLVPMVPGPITAPLSSSLSAIVADTLRRGVDTRSLRRKRSVGRSRLSGFLPRRDGGRQHAADSDDGGERADGAATASSTLRHVDSRMASSARHELNGEGAGTRGRSLSATLGDMFRRKKRRTEDGRGTSDERPVDEYSSDVERTAS